MLTANVIKAAISSETYLVKQISGLGKEEISVAPTHLRCARPEALTQTHTDTLFLNRSI